MSHVELIDACCLCQGALDAAGIIAQDFTEGYFGPELENAAYDAGRLVGTYNEHRIRADILQDYIIKAQQFMESIHRMAKQGDPSRQGTVS